MNKLISAKGVDFYIEKRRKKNPVMQTELNENIQRTHGVMMKGNY